MAMSLTLCVQALAAILVAFSIHVRGSNTDGCTCGFMDKDLITVRADKIPSGNAASSYLGSSSSKHEVRLIPDWRFTCSGNITSVLLGADMPDYHLLRYAYPRIQVWRYQGSDVYNRVDERSIQIPYGQFSTNGVLQYNLSDPLAFQNGDVLGLYHPSQGLSRVRVFYKNDNSAPDNYRDRFGILSSPPSSIDIDDEDDREDELILLTVITDTPCTNGMLSPETLIQKTQQLNINNVTRFDSIQKVFPDINFTCNGILTKWIVGGETGASVGAELQIWRNTGGSNYTKIDSSVVMATDPDNDNVYEYNPIPPLEFQEGDILGVYQRSGSNRMRMYYQVSTGPENYANSTSNDVALPVPDTITGAQLRANEYDYPLVSVEVAMTSSTTSSIIAVTSTTVPVLKTSMESTLAAIPSQPITTNFIDATSAQQSFPSSSYMQTATVVLANSVPGSTFTVSSMSTSATSVSTTSEAQTTTFSNQFTSDLANSVSVSTLTVSSQSGTFTTSEAQTTTAVSNQFTSNLANTVAVPIQSTRGAKNTELQPTIATSTQVSSSSTKEPVAASIETMKQMEISSHRTQPLVVSTSSVPLPPIEEASIAGPVSIVVVILLVVVVAVGIGIIVAALVLNKRRKQKVFELAEKNIQSPLGMSNPVYDNKPIVNSEKPIIANSEKPGFEIPVYLTIIENDGIELYKRDENYGRSNPSSEPQEISAYEMSTEFLQSQPDMVYKVITDVPDPLPWGIIVPTQAQRELHSDSSLQRTANMTDEELYMYIAQRGSMNYETPLQLNQNRQSLFRESDTYWEPSADCTSIYDQLAKQKFREIFRQQINVSEVVGSGQFGKVCKGVWQTQQGELEVAVKTLKNKASEQEKVWFLQEAAIMGQFHHPNVVKLYGVVTLGEPAMIILEYMVNGDLREYLQHLRPVPGELPPTTLPQQLLDYCRQIASGMEYLSRKSFVHRDLAARNILVDDQKRCKIADFGMSRSLQNDDYYLSKGGIIPLKWTAIEAVFYKKYSTASDVWSFGVLMYEIWSLGHKPFEGIKNVEAFKMIEEGVRLAPPPGCPRMIYTTMIECWNPNPSDRPQFAALVSKLSQPEAKLLAQDPDDTSLDRAAMLGSSLEATTDLFLDLQQSYVL